jgi:hypothetical protein
LTRSRLTSNETLGRQKPSSRDFSATITALKSAPDRARAELIRDVVDAFRRLHGSVQRFVLMFADLQGEAPSKNTFRSASFNRLLSILAEQGKATEFSRIHELKVVIKEARSAERLRDAIFSDVYSDNPVALRKVVAELERLDATLVGLCVEHVLEEHGRSALAVHTN